MRKLVLGAAALAAVAALLCVGAVDSAAAEKKVHECLTCKEKAQEWFGIEYCGVEGHPQTLEHALKKSVYITCRYYCGSPKNTKDCELSNKLELTYTQFTRPSCGAEWTCKDLTMGEDWNACQQVDRDE